MDRLERAGLAEQRAVPADRRVRHVVLTSKGERVRAELLLGLRRKELEALARALGKL